MFVYRLCLHCRWFWKARSTCETHLRHFEFAKFWYFVTWPFAEPKFASAHQISSKSDDSRLRYSDKAIFNMAAVRHLEFSKFDILVTWLVSERDSASDKRVYVWEGVLCVDCRTMTKVHYLAEQVSDSRLSRVCWADPAVACIRETTLSNCSKLVFDSAETPVVVVVVVALMAVECLDADTVARSTNTYTRVGGLV